MAGGPGALHGKAEPWGACAELITEGPMLQPDLQDCFACTNPPVLNITAYPAPQGKHGHRKGM